MKSTKRTMISILFGIALLIIILDARTAYIGAYQGVQLCINSLIPTILPFIILTKLICSSVKGPVV